MPIFEYICKECSQEFEAIVNGGSRPKCPECQSETLEQKLSVFAVGPAGTKSKSSSPPGSCGSCGDPRGPGACSMN